ncbi:hypothetical protein C8J57DRAFT_1504238 [Mycena rebaudengoi]|nr:hypothetical protein C8J57DRAFT_1504238 [Mycena rebaudengoi]
MHVPASGKRRALLPLAPVHSLLQPRSVPEKWRELPHSPPPAPGKCRILAHSPTVTGAKRKHILCRAFLLYLTVPARSLLRATNSRAKRVRPARRDAHLAPHPPNPASVSAASTAAPNVIIWFLVPGLRTLMSVGFDW